jgi:hypothetical protein
MAELSAYQKKKQVTDLLQTLDKGQKGQLLEALLGEWAETLPKKGKEFGVSGGDGKFEERLKWLQEHWGTAFEAKGTTALRKMPLSGVLELLTLFVLGGADSTDEALTFGSLEDGSELGEKVAAAVDAMKQTAGPKVVITMDAYKHLQAIKRVWSEEGNVAPEVSTKILEMLKGALKSMPAVKSEAEMARAAARKKG